MLRLGVDYYPEHWPASRWETDAKLMKKAAPRLRVLAHSEIPETHTIRIGKIIGEAQ